MCKLVVVTYGRIRTVEPTLEGGLWMTIFKMAILSQPLRPIGRRWIGGWGAVGRIHRKHYRRDACPFPKKLIHECAHNYSGAKGTSFRPMCKSMVRSFPNAVHKNVLSLVNRWSTAVSGEVHLSYLQLKLHAYTWDWRYV